MARGGAVGPVQENRAAKDTEEVGEREAEVVVPPPSAASHPQPFGQDQLGQCSMFLSEFGQDV